MINLKKFHKVSSDEHSTLLKHEDGHEFKVAHSGLTPKLRKEIDRIPMAEGEKLQGDFERSQFPERSSQAEPQKLAEGDYVEDPAQATLSGLGQLEANQQTDYRAPSTDPLSASRLAEPPLNPSMPSQQQLDQGSQLLASIQHQGQPEGPPSPTSDQQAAGQFQAATGYNENTGQFNQPGQQQFVTAEQQALQDSMNAKKHLLDSFSAKKAELDKHAADVRNDIEKTHIDASAFYTPEKKIFSALGLIIGGLGGPEGAKMVSSFLKDQQDKFLESQKANLGKKKTILDALQQQYKDDQVAYDMSHVVSNELLLDRLNKIQAPINNQMTQAKMAELKMKILQDSEQWKAQAAQKQMLNELRTTGGKGDPSQYVQYVVPKERQKEVFDEIKKSQDAKRAESHLFGSFEAMDKENTVLGRATHLGATPASVSDYEANILPLVKDNEGRVNEFELNTLRALEPKPGDLPGKVQEKRAALKQFLETKKSAPTAKGFGIDLDKFQSTSRVPVKFTPSK